MSQGKKKGNDGLVPTPNKTTPRELRKAQKMRRTSIVIASVVLVMVLAIVGVSYYFSEDARYNRLAIITVDGTSIRMDSFLKRAKLSGTDAMTLMGQMIDEQVIKQMAPEFGIEISPEDIDQGLKLSASGGTGNITDAEFKEWYRQRLNETKLTNTEYREIARTSLSAGRLQEYLAERVSPLAEQVHVHIIIVGTLKEAQKVKARLDAGEKFADLAREVSLDSSNEAGGDIGWYPRGALTPAIEYMAFNLDVGSVSEPQLLADQSAPDTGNEAYYLMTVSEKEAARQLSEENLQIVKGQALKTWLSQELQNHDIKLNYNSEINAWINWQLSKNKPASSATSGG